MFCEIVRQYLDERFHSRVNNLAYTNIFARAVGFNQMIKSSAPGALAYVKWPRWRLRGSLRA